MLSLALALQAAVVAPVPVRPAEIADAAWLAGRWVGEGMGGTAEEVWSPASGGQMVGHFALSLGGKPLFYEIMLLDRTDKGLRLRVKHFNPDFTAWEDRGGWHSFEPKQVGPDELRFTGLTMRRVGDRLTIIVTMRGDDGSIRNEPFVLRRAPF